MTLDLHSGAFSPQNCCSHDREATKGSMRAADKRGEKPNKRKLQTDACGLMFRTLGAASMTDDLSWRTILIFGNLLHSSIAAPPTPPPTSTIVAS